MVNCPVRLSPLLPPLLPPLLLLQGPGDTLGLGGEGGSSSDAAGASYLDAFATFRDEVGGAGFARTVETSQGPLCATASEAVAPGMHN